MATPLAEKSRIKLLNAYIGDVRAWKGDDPAETLIIAVKNPAQDADDTSFYALPKGATAVAYLGTTVLGKDGGCQPIVYNDGTVAVLITETPLAGQSGTLADLYLVTLQYKIAGEPAVGGGTIDTTAREAVKKLARDLSAAALLND